MDKLSKQVDHSLTHSLIHSLIHSFPNLLSHLFNYNLITLCRALLTFLYCPIFICHFFCKENKFKTKPLFYQAHNVRLFRDPISLRSWQQGIKPALHECFITWCYNWTAYFPPSLLILQLALHVLSFLPPQDLLRAAQTCKAWRTLTSENLLWKERCEEEGINEATAFEDTMVRCANSW